MHATDPLFYGTRGPIDGSAKYAIVGEAWGQNEERAQRPFVGSSGQLLDRLLAGAGINPADCFFTNVVAVRPENNDFSEFLRPGKGQWRGTVNPTHLLEIEVARLHKQLSQLRPEKIITCGNWPLWALTDCCETKSVKGYHTPVGVARWRGSMLRSETGQCLVPIYHPAAILRQWELYYTTLHDLKARALRPAWQDFRELNLLIPKNAAELLTWAADYFTTPTERRLVVDVETMQGQTHIVGMAKSKTDAVAIPFCHGYYSQEEEAKLRYAVHIILNHPKALLVGQNLIYDMQWLDRDFLVQPRAFFDTMLAHHVLWPGTPKSLDHIASLYCDYYTFWKDEGKEWEPGDDVQTICRYNGYDTTYTYECALELDALIDQLNMRAQFVEHMDTWAFAMDLTLRGTRVDRNIRQQLVENALEKQSNLELKLSQLIPNDPQQKKPWYRSPTQQAAIFYDRMGITPVFNRKTKLRTVDDTALPILKEREPLLAPVLDALEEYRSVSVELSNVLLAPISPDGRARSSFDPAGTETFRFASRKDAFGTGFNLQNLKRMESE